VLTRRLPDPGPDDVVVKTLFSGISHGTEMNVYRGLAPQWSKRFDRDLRLFVPVTPEVPATVPKEGYWTAADTHWGYPLSYGYANVGRVAARGSAVDLLQEGDLVYAYQPHQTAYVARAASVIRLPGLANPALGVLYSNLNTAYGGVLDADIRIDDTVVVFGQGLIGLLVTQVLRRTAARRIITVEKIPARKDLSIELGADECLDPASVDVALAVRERTGGRGADVVIEASGSYAALQEAIRTAAPNTTVVALSWYGGTGAELALSDEFHHNRITIRSSQVGGIAPELSATHSLSRRVEQIMDWFGELELDRLLTTFIPFDEASFAYDLIDLRGEEAIQVVLRYDG
jgi:threonine dehydrogenase-like Zn-dependent dehydrogenase